MDAVNELWRGVTLNGAHKDTTDPAAQSKLGLARHAYERYYHVYAW